MMRRFHAFIAFSAIATMPLHGQAQFGVVGGFVSSNISVSEGASAGQKSRTGFAAGVSLSTPVGQSLDFTPELLYVLKGATADAGNGITAAAKINYVEVPLVFRYTFSSSGGAKPFLLAGPEVAMKASCNISGTNGVQTAEEACKVVDPADEPKSVDYGVIFGVGLAVNKFAVTVRYDLGLANIRDNTSSGSSKNTALMILIGIRF